MGNSNQPDLFSGAELRDEGMKRAEDHANRVYDDWSEQAYQFALFYISRHDHEFMIEELRSASIGVVPEPPHLRAWGSIATRLVKNNVIKRTGYRNVKNAKAHCAPCSVWIRI